MNHKSADEPKQTKVFRTHDEEWNAASRLGSEITDWLETMALDTVNEEYAVVVEVIKL